MFGGKRQLGVYRIGKDIFQRLYVKSLAID